MQDWSNNWLVYCNCRFVIVLKTALNCKLCSILFEILYQSNGSLFVPNNLSWGTRLCYWLHNTISVCYKNYLFNVSIEKITSSGIPFSPVRDALAHYQYRIPNLAIRMMLALSLYSLFWDIHDYQASEFHSLRGSFYIISLINLRYTEKWKSTWLLMIPITSHEKATPQAARQSIKIEKPGSGLSLGSRRHSAKYHLDLTLDQRTKLVLNRRIAELLK